jgi:hypothetical protein
MLLELLAGALLALGFVVIARQFGRRGEMFVYAVGLVTAAVIYVGFAVVGGADPRWLGVEVAGLLPYAGFAWLSTRSPWWLAAGWLAHAGWDTGLHLVAGTPAFVPGWYPAVCMGFDGLVAATIAWRMWTRRTSAPAAAPLTPGAAGYGERR